MAYRYTASGVLELSERNVSTVCSILERKHIRHERTGTSVRIAHDERASTPNHLKPGDAFEDLAPYIDTPQSVQVNCELLGEYEVGFVDGRVRMDRAVHVWSNCERVPTPDELVNELRARGIAAKVGLKRTSRKSSRRARIFVIQPGSGGHGCKVTVKRRFWDSFDLLSVPDVYRPLCRKYHMTPERLREELRGAKFGMEVRKPALGSASCDMLFDQLLDVIEDLTEGVRTDIG